jgi:glycosyltransferase involved in cell wall biosynthesis
MKTLTVFTPTYNRAHTLARTYKSLCNQTCNDFEWLVIDDGSVDNTEELVKGWIVEGRISIRYIKKENGGLHTGYTMAIANMETELNVCIDSDDFMPDNGVEIIVTTWENECRGKNLAGIIGLDYLLDGTPNGGMFANEGIYHIYEIRGFHRGDDKKVCRTDLLKALKPMPVFEGEKNFNPIYYYIQVDAQYKFQVINKNLCFIDYQPDGMSAGIFRQFRDSPHSFAQLRRLYMSMNYEKWTTHFRNSIHYVSSCIFGKEWDFLKTSPRPFTTLLAIPLGILLNIYICYKTR